MWKVKFVKMGGSYENNNWETYGFVVFQEHFKDVRIPDGIHGRDNNI